jgi:putative heme-binding domain-containing protein
MRTLCLFPALLLGAVMSHAATRIPWVTSTIAGSPEAAKPFVEEQVFPKLRFSEGLELATVPGTDRLLVVERRGKISSFPLRSDVDAMDEVLDLLPLHPILENAFGVVLHPRFRATRQIFVCYALRAGLADGTRVSRFTLTSLEPLRADPASEEILLAWVSGGHNGGSLQFGPEGYLYISAGDAGPAAPPDPAGTGQDVSDIPASILRIDVDHREPGKKYRVPPDNPWADRSAPANGAAIAQAAAAVRPELWAYGLRNPWKISFDRANGNLWCGDVGWEMWELVYLITRGANYGWSAYEGSQPVKPQLANLLAPITRPVVAHPHSEAASMTGGFVYHGKRLPELQGAYIYGDYVTGKIWALWHDQGGITRHEEIADTPHAIVTFGEADDGELYYLHYAGRTTTVHRLIRNPQVTVAAQFPRTLRATGLFADVPRLEPAAGVYPFAISTPMWEDGSAASRWIALRDRTAVGTRLKVEPDRKARRARPEYTTAWPNDAVLARTITLGSLALTPADRTKPVETQVLHFDGRDWNAYAYRWNEAGTDAELVSAGGAEMTLRVASDRNAMGESRDYTWRFQSRAECLRCHNTRTTGALAFTPEQLRTADGGQLKALIERGIVNADFFRPSRSDGRMSADENAAARALLHTNCAHCHAPHAGGSVSVFLTRDLPLTQMNIVGVPPAQGGFGLKEPKLVAPGDPWNSVLAIRMAKTGSGHMPLIGARDVDVEGLKVIEDWIAGMSSEAAAPKPWSKTALDAATIESEIKTVAGAMRIRRAIDDGKLANDLRAGAFKAAWASPDSTVRDIFERFKPDELRERTLGANVDPAAILQLRGDPARGARLVATDGKLASCQACHFIQGQGRHFGPDLSRIGSQQSAAQILESLITPSKAIGPLYRTAIFELKDGTSHAGFVRARGASEIVLTIPGGQSVKLKHAELVAEKTLPNSLMPEGQLQGLTPQEAADLVAYLASLK